MAQQAYAQPQAVAYAPSAYAPVYGQEQQFVQVAQPTYAAVQPGLQPGYASAVRPTAARACLTSMSVLCCSMRPPGGSPVRRCLPYEA